MPATRGISSRASRRECARCAKSSAPNSCAAAASSSTRRARGSRPSRRARGRGGDRAEGPFPVVGARHQRQPGEPPLVWVSEAAHDIYGFDAGKTIELPLNGKSVRVTVGGVVRDYARQHGAIAMERADYVALTGDRRVNDAAVWLRPGVTPAQAMGAIRSLPGGAGLDVAAPPEIREVSLAIFDRSFAVTYAMEAVAVLVGLFGLSSSRS